MTLRQLICFREVARVLNFTQAAKNLSVSQPSVSHSIRTLEEELNVPLFVRYKYKNLILTAYGKSFLTYVEKAINEIERGKSALAQESDADGGIVKLSYGFVNGHYTVQELIGSFYEQENDQHITILLNVHHEPRLLSEDIKDGAADLAIGCSITDDIAVETEKIYDQKLYCILNTEHPLADKPRVTLEDIRDENIIRLNTGTSLHEWTTYMFRSSGIKPRFIDDYDDWSMMVQQIANNKGITIAPHMMFNAEELKAVPLDHPMGTRSVYLFWSATRCPSPAVEYVRKFCLDYFK